MRNVKESILRIRQGLLCLLCVCCCSFSAFAQGGKTISGNVTDGKGEAIIGASVAVKGTITGTVTDANGNFNLTAGTDAVLLISYLGFKTQEVAVGNQTKIAVTLSEDFKTLDEVLVVGYGTQKKATLTGAVSQVKGGELITTKNENVVNMLTGKLAGVRSIQRTSEPGAFYTQLDIRGMGTPLIIIDGIPRDEASFQRIDPNDIESISVLKDATAAIYGVRSANGVFLVTTRKGETTDAKPKINYSGSYTFQVPTGFPHPANSADYMELANEMAWRRSIGVDGSGGSHTFSDDQINAFLTGAQKDTDWTDLVFSKWSPQTMHNVNITGGSKRTGYYVGMGYESQEGFFKSGDLNYHKYNVRSNLSTRITDRLRFDVNLSALMDNDHRPRFESQWIIRGYWRSGAHWPAYADQDQTMLYHGLMEGWNSIGYSDSDYSGYQNNNKKWLQSSAGLNYDIPGINGLAAKVLFSYDYYGTDQKTFKKSWNQYRYSEAAQAYESYLKEGPDQMQRSTNMQNQMMTQASLNFDRKFDVHKVNAVVVWETQKREGDNFLAQRDLAIPLDYLFAGVASNQQGTMNSNEANLYRNANNALAGRVNYTFADKYIAEALFRYDGSSKFGTDHQYGFFPAASLGWRISEENFFKNPTLSFIEQLKLRASYGVTGDDAAAGYQFISGYVYPAPSTWYRTAVGGYVFNGNYVNGAINKGITNPAITWYTSKTFNIGVDFSAWNGLLGGTFEYFDRHRTGLLAKKTGGIPSVVGAQLPDENLNGDQTFGLEMELTHRNKIGNVSYGLKGLFSVTRIKTLHVESAPFGSSWLNWKGNSNNRLNNTGSGSGQNWYYTDAGRFTSWEDVYTYNARIGSTLLGDYKYEDWNGDGVINGNDQHVFRFGSKPWMNFSLLANAEWKKFDLQLLFQGAGMSKYTYIEQLRAPSMENNGNTGTQFLDRWHPVDPGANPYDPATEWVRGKYIYGVGWGFGAEQDSEVNSVNSSYLRLKSMEFGYSIPVKRYVQSLRIYVNTYNIFTLTKMKDVDPEHPEDSTGYMYPINKTVSLGLNVTF
ncbi:SusC/RagA family TonB-linked outer membrane protein [Bacteroidia bacterium]|nr:SusC/RagA family TonB-linked outer membrane protein [Bacteroidia bacterium]